MGQKNPLRPALWGRNSGSIDSIDEGPPAYASKSSITTLGTLEYIEEGPPVYASKDSELGRSVAATGDGTEKSMSFCFLTQMLFPNKT